MHVPFKQLYRNQFTALIDKLPFMRKIVEVDMQHTWKPIHVKYKGHETFEGKFAPIITAMTVAMMGMSVNAAEPTLLKDIGVGFYPFSVVGTTQNHLYASSGAVIAYDRDTQLGTKLLPKEVSGEFIALGTIALFSYNDDVHGNELWRSDGTRAGTFLVKDLVEGSESGSPRTFVNWRGKVYFTTPGRDNERDAAYSELPQLWSTDGTVEGTQLITNLDTLRWFDGGEDGRQAVRGRVLQLVAGQDKLFFNVDIIYHPFEFQEISLWQSDGTASGTSKMVYPENDKPVFASDLLQTVGGVTFFADNQPFWSDYAYDWEIGKLWRMDASGQERVVLSETLALPTIGVLNGRVYFLTRDDSGVYLARTDASATTVETIALLYPASSVGYSIAGNIKFVAGKSSLFVGIYSYSMGEAINAIWHFSDAEYTTTKVIDSIDYEDVEALFVKDDMLYFRYGSGDNIELWRSDGTLTGTGLFMDLNPTGSSNPLLLQLFAGEIWFVANDGTRGSLFRTDGAHSVRALQAYASRAIGSQPRQFTALKNGVTMFRGFSWYYSTYATIGTPETTTQPPFSGLCGTCDFAPLFPISNGALFLDSSRATLWYMDGRNGTQFIKVGMWPSALNRYPITKTMFAPLGQNTALFFAVEQNTDETYSRKLWRTDGSPAGTMLVKTLPLPIPASTNITPEGIESLVPHQQLVYFMGNDRLHGNELWRTDGSESGTYMVKELVPGDAEVVIQNITSARHHVYFTYTDKHGTHLAKSRGTAKDTRRVTSLPANISAIQDVTGVNDSIFFRSGHHLYRSNGRAGDLCRLGHFRFSSVNKSSYDRSETVTTDGPAEMTAFGDHLYFIARKNAASPLQIWRADLKKPKAEVVTPKFKVNALGAKDVDFYVHGNRLFLAVLDRTGQGGGIFELRTSGKNLQWVRHTSMSARELRVAGDKLYFAGLDDKYGEEPRVMTLPKKP